MSCEQFYRLLFYYCSLWEKCFLGRMGFFVAVPWVATGKNRRACWEAAPYPGLIIHPWFSLWCPTTASLLVVTLETSFRGKLLTLIFWVFFTTCVLHYFADSVLLPETFLHKYLYLYFSKGCVYFCHFGSFTTKKSELPRSTWTQQQAVNKNPRLA